MKNLKRSQILTSNYPYYKYSLNYALDSLHRMGAEQIEFYACFPHFHMDDITYRDIKSLKKKLKDFGLKAMCVTPEQCLYPVNIAAFDIAARNRSINVFKKQLKQQLNWKQIQSLLYADMGQLMRRMKMYGNVLLIQ